jgi:hypothetical protein
MIVVYLGAEQAVVSLVVAVGVAFLAVGEDVDCWDVVEAAIHPAGVVRQTVLLPVSILHISSRIFEKGH